MCNTSEETANGIIFIKPTEHKKSLSSDTEQLCTSGLHSAISTQNNYGDELGEPKIWPLRLSISPSRSNTIFILIISILHWI